MKSKASIPAIIGSLVLVAGAFLYTRYAASNYTLPAEWEAASGETVQYHYVRRVPDRKGGYRHVDCYSVQPFRNKAQTVVKPGCIDKYKLDAICEQASCKENQP